MPRRKNKTDLGQVVSRDCDKLAILQGAQRWVSYRDNLTKLRVLRLVEIRQQIVFLTKLGLRTWELGQKSDEEKILESAVTSTKSPGYDVA